jgi:hypothetical protein
MARGGRRTPENPAPVSGPGALSRRTDGGAGQPIRSFPAQSQGQRQQLAALQQSAPLSAGGDSPLPQVGSPPAPPQSPGAPGGILGPTARPNEPLNAGLNNEPRILPRDPDALLRALYQAYPHPDIARLIQGA